MRCVGGAARWVNFMKRGRRRAWITPKAKCFGNRNLGLWITRQAKINKAKPNYATGRPRGPSPVPKKPYKAISWTGEMLSALRQWWKRKNPGGWGWLYSRCNLKLANWATCPSPTVDKSFSTSSSHTRDVRVGAVGRYKYTKTWCASFGFIIITSQKRATIDMCHVRGGWATSSRPLLEHLLRIPPIAADIESHSYIEIWET